VGEASAVKEASEEIMFSIKKNKLNQCTFTYISDRPGKMVTHCVGLAVAGILDLFLDGTHSTCGALSS